MDLETSDERRRWSSAVAIVCCGLCAVSSKLTCQLTCGDTDACHVRERPVRVDRRVSLSGPVLRSQLPAPTGTARAAGTPAEDNTIVPI